MPIWYCNHAATPCYPTLLYGRMHISLNPLQIMRFFHKEARPSMNFQAHSIIFAS